jgi:nucleotide-binding universal stress UspA family protein
MEIKKVLVAVDFSPVSRWALDCAIALARSFNAKLSLLHIVEWPSALLHAYPHEAERVEAQRRCHAEKILPTLVGPQNRDDLDARFLVRAGEIQEVIEAVIDEERADVLVLGTHGRGLFARCVLGSVTNALLRQVNIPVLTVSHATNRLRFERVLFATDFGVDAHKAFRHALDFAAATDSTLVVAHAIDSMDAQATTEGRQQTLRLIHERLDEYRAEGTLRKVPVVLRLAEGSAGEWLVRIADQHEADLLILGLRRKGLIERALLGSTAEFVIRSSRIPVLSFPIGTPVAVLEEESSHQAMCAR